MKTQICFPEGRCDADSMITHNTHYEKAVWAGSLAEEEPGEWGPVLRERVELSGTAWNYLIPPEKSQ